MLFRTFINIITPWLILFAALSGCMPGAGREKPGPIPQNKVWPSTLDPKIKLVGIYSSRSDIECENKSGFFEKLLIEDENIADRLIRPYNIALDNDERIYVTDVKKVFVFDLKNKKLSFIGGRAGDVKFKTPIGVAVAPNGAIYISDARLAKVFTYDANGKYAGELGDAGDFVSPAGMIVDAVNKRLYVADTKKNEVRAYTLEGKFIFSLGGRDSEKERFNFPTNIAVDSEGSIYIVDSGNLRVQVYSPEGKFLKSIRGEDKNRFVRPKGIAIDSEDRIHIVDAAAQRLVIYDRDGKLIMSVGSGGTGPGEFSVPAGIAVSAGGKIYVVDQLNARIQVFQHLDGKDTVRDKK